VRNSVSTSCNHILLLVLLWAFRILLDQSRGRRFLALSLLVLKASDFVGLKVAAANTIIVHRKTWVHVPLVWVKGLDWVLIRGALPYMVWGHLSIGPGTFSELLFLHTESQCAIFALIGIFWKLNRLIFLLVVVVGVGLPDRGDLGAILVTNGPWYFDRLVRELAVLSLRVEGLLHRHIILLR